MKLNIACDDECICLEHNI